MRIDKQNKKLSYMPNNLTPYIFKCVLIPKSQKVFFPHKISILPGVRSVFTTSSERAEATKITRLVALAPKFL